jgi:anaerobic magnesium-protoporphyrin IX monomethyl ester cyclase
VLPKVALINVGFEPGEPIVQRSPPFGIMCVGAYLRANSIEVCLFDWSGQVLGEDRKKELRDSEPNIVGFTVLVSSSIARASTVSNWAKEIGATVVWGGPGTTTLTDMVLREAPVDVAVIGEGEQTMLELCVALKGKSNLNGIEGIAFLLNGTVVRTAPRQRITDLDSLPMPLWDAVGDLGSYLIPFNERMAMPMVTSRGCPGTCNFCYTKKVWGYKWVARSPEKIVEEIMLVRHLDPKLGAVSFDDDLFACSHDRVGKLCELLIEKRMDLRWTCEMRVDQVDEDLLVLMKKAGCRMVLLGVESGSQRMLDIAMKSVKVEQIKEAFKVVHKVGMESLAFIMVGLPGETEEDFRQTKRLLKTIKADRHELKVYMPYPGTKMLDVAKEHGFNEPRSLVEWARNSEVHRSYIKDRNLSEVPWEKIQAFARSLERRERRQVYWREFKNNPMTAPLRALKRLIRPRNS